jgi:hypothetical protein
MGTTLHTELVVKAFEMAVRRRQAKGAIAHSDQGCQYTSLTYGRRIREAGLVQSMGSRGDSFDNAMAESFFATLECELLDRQTFRTRDEARSAIFDLIEAYYNHRAPPLLAQSARPGHALASQVRTPLVDGSRSRACYEMNTIRHAPWSVSSADDRSYDQGRDAAGSTAPTPAASTPSGSVTRNESGVPPILIRATSSTSVRFSTRPSSRRPGGDVRPHRRHPTRRPRKRVNSIYR